VKPTMAPEAAELVALNFATNCSVDGDKKASTLMHSIDGGRSRASAQHATHDKFTESRDNSTPLIEIKKIPTNVHSTGGCRSRASAQHGTQD
jgi:hypothetical protein